MAIQGTIFSFSFPPPTHHTIPYHGKMGMGFIPSGGYTSTGVFHSFGHLIPFVILKPRVEDTPARPGCTPGTLPALQLPSEASKPFPSEEWILLCITPACAAELADHDVKFH